MTHPIPLSTLSDSVPPELEALVQSNLRSGETFGRLDSPNLTPELQFSDGLILLTNERVLSWQADSAIENKKTSCREGWCGVEGLGAGGSRVPKSR